MTLCVCVGGWRGERGKIIGVKGVRKRKTGESEEGGGGRKEGVVTAGAQTTLPDMQSR